MFVNTIFVFFEISVFGLKIRFFVVAAIKKDGPDRWRLFILHVCCESGESIGGPTEYLKRVELTEIDISCCQWVGGVVRVFLVLFSLSGGVFFPVQLQFFGLDGR